MSGRHWQSSTAAPACSAQRSTRTVQFLRRFVPFLSFAREGVVEGKRMWQKHIPCQKEHGGRGDVWRRTTRRRWCGGARGNRTYSQQQMWQAAFFPVEGGGEGKEATASTQTHSGILLSFLLPLLSLLTSDIAFLGTRRLFLGFWGQMRRGDCFRPLSFGS